jgi:hypothetical protein
MTSVAPDLVSREQSTSTARSTSLLVRLSAFRPPDIVTVLCVGLVGFVITFLRCPETIRHPELYAEDGVVWFSSAYQQGPFHPLLEAHTGYLQTFPRLVADVGLLVPLRWLPLFFVVVAVVVQVMPAALVASRRFATIVPSFQVRLLLALLYLLIPNSTEVNANLTNAQWHLGLLAFMVVIADAGGWWWRTFDVAVVVLSGLTGPFVLVVAPIAIVVVAMRRRPWTLVLTIILCVEAVVQGITLLVTPRGTFAALGMTPGRFAEIVGGQVVGGTVIGPPATELGHVLTSDPVLCALLMLGGGLLCGAALWRGSMELRLFNILAMLVLLSSLLSPVASLTEPQWQALVGDAGARYWFFPAMALTVDMVWLAGQVRYWRGIPAALGAVLLTVTVMFGVRASFEYPALQPRPNWPAEVHAFDEARVGQQFTFQIIPTGWTFTLIKR